MGVPEERKKAGPPVRHRERRPRRHMELAADSRRPRGRVRARSSGGDWAKQGRARAGYAACRDDAEWRFSV